MIRDSPLAATLNNSVSDLGEGLFLSYELIIDDDGDSLFFPSRMMDDNGDSFFFPSRTMDDNGDSFFLGLSAIEVNGDSAMLLDGYFCLFNLFIFGNEIHLVISVWGIF